MRLARESTMVALGTSMAMLSFTTPAAAQATIGGEWREDVSRFARQLVDAGLTPGMSVGIAAGDWVVFAEGFGVADMASGRAATGDTPFYIASTTKSLTGLAAAIAIHRGELDPDAPMVRYLPKAQLPDNIARESISVRELLTMTHGISGNGPVVLRTAYTGEFTTDQLLDLLRHHSAGEQGAFAYGNIGYNLLGLVLEAVYKESWKDVVHRLVLEPLGMGSTTARVSSLPANTIALPHAWTPAGFAPGVLHKTDANLHAAGGHFTSARDLARYVAAHLGGGILEGDRVLPAGPVLATQTAHVPQNRRFGAYSRTGWGYGFDIGMYDGDTLVGRFGSFSGYRSHMSFMPQRGIGVVVLVNGDGPSFDVADIMANYVYDRLLGKPDFAARGASAIDSLARQAAESKRGIAEHLAERAARLAPLPHPLDSYAGTYESPVLGTMVWRVVAGGLEMRLGAVHSRAEIFNPAANELRIEVAGGGQVVKFAFSESGGPARAVTMAGMEFVRVR